MRAAKAGDAKARTSVRYSYTLPAEIRERLDKVVDLAGKRHANLAVAVNRGGEVGLAVDADGDDVAGAQHESRLARRVLE